LPGYYIYSFTIAAIQAVSTPFFTDSKISLTIAKWNALILIGAIWILSFFSIVYGVLKLKSSGISKEALKVIMSRHGVSILFFLIVELYV